MNGKKLNNLIVFSFILLFASCATVNNLQTAETLEKGEIRQTIAVGYGGIDVDEEDNTDDIAASTFVVDYMIRYGLTENDEFGLRLANFATYLQGDYKRALVKSENFYLSAGIALGGTQVTIGSGSTEIKQTYIDLSFPIYMDYKVSEKSTLFLSPKYMLSFVSTSGDTDEDSSSISRVGSSAGYKFGDQSGFIAEVGYLKSLKNNAYDLWQFTGGFFF